MYYVQAVSLSGIETLHICNSNTSSQKLFKDLVLKGQWTHLWKSFAAALAVFFNFCYLVKGMNIHISEF